MAHVDQLSVFLFLIAVLPIVYAGNNTTAIISPSPSSLQGNSTTSSNRSSRFTIHLTTTPMQTHTPGHHTFTSMAPNHNITSTAAVMNSTTSMRPTAAHSTVYPTTSVNFTTVQPPTTAQPTTDCHTCEKMLASERRYKWAAVSFDLIFAVALAVMTVMYLRLRKMYREMEGDGSLSRLI